MTVELTEHLYWIEDCFTVGGDADRHIHGSPYLLCADGASVLVDTGAVPNREMLRSTIDEVADGLDAIVITKAHLPHSANVMDLLDVSEEVEVVATAGLPESYGFVPEFTDRVEKTRDGTSVDVVGTSFEFIVPPLLDVQHSTWIYHPATGVIFTSDGLGHYHAPGECAMTSRDFPDGIRRSDVLDYHREALKWLQYVDPERLMRDVRPVFDRRDVSVVAPAHGNPILREDVAAYLDDLERSIDRIAAGFSLPGD